MLCARQVKRSVRLLSFATVEKSEERIIICFMRNLKTLLFVSLTFWCSCTAQTRSDVEWKTFDFSDSGIKVALPCEPSREAKVFQKEPKLAQRYDYGCKKNNLDFSVSLAEHFNEFDPNKAGESFDNIEEMLRNSIKDKATLGTKDTTFQAFAAREITSENENLLGKILLVQNKRGTYNVLLMSRRDANQSKENFNVEFQKNAQQLFDSFEISPKE